MSYSLLIIDAQPYFSAVNNRLVKEIKSEIHEAIKDNMNIIFVDIPSCNEIHSELLKATKNYTKTHFVSKHGEDGSHEITKLIKRKALPRKHLKVVGCNTDQCVYRTVRGLRNTLPISNIQIIKNACGSESYESHKYGIHLLKQLQKVVVFEY